MIRKDNTIYVRKRIMDRDSIHTKYKFEAFVKTKKEVAIVGGVTREGAVFAGNVMLWAINKFGVDDYKKQGPLNDHPDLPKDFNYEVIDE